MTWIWTHRWELLFIAGVVVMALKVIDWSLKKGY